MDSIVCNGHIPWQLEGVQSRGIQMEHVTMETGRDENEARGILGSDNGTVRVDNCPLPGYNLISL